MATGALDWIEILRSATLNANSVSASTLAKGVRHCIDSARALLVETPEITASFEAVYRECAAYADALERSRSEEVDETRQRALSSIENLCAKVDAAKPSVKATILGLG